MPGTGVRRTGRGGRWIRTEVCPVEVSKEIEETGDRHDTDVELANECPLLGRGIMFVCPAKRVELDG